MKESLKEIKSKEILKSIINGLKDVRKGKTHSIYKLWDEISSTSKKQLEK